jgi:hypothetical protein
MIIAVLLAGLVFYEAFVALKAISNVQTMQKTMAASLLIVQSKSMSDEDKATAMQRSSIAMISAVAITLTKISLAGIATLTFLLVVSLVAWPLDEMLEYSISPAPLVATIVVLTVYGIIRHGRRKA